MSSIRENRLFLGNPGAGKSTLINCLVGSSKLKAGLSWGGGLTQDYQRVDHDGVAYMDTPGLADTAIADQAASAITMALRQGGQYKLFFLLRLQSGRVVSEDLVTLERVLGAIDMAAPKIRFSVVFNNVDKKQYNQLTQPESDAFKAVHRVVNGRQFKTDAFCFIPQIAELDEASDAVITLPQHVRDFMDETAPSMRIKPSVVRPVDPTGFAQQARLIQEEMEKLLTSRATMMATMATQQQQNAAAMQREREAHAAQLQSMQCSSGAVLSPNFDGDYYDSHPLTPPIVAAVGEPENKPVINRKKLLVVVGVAAGLLVLITIIVVATRGSGDKPNPVPTPTPNETSTPIPLPASLQPAPLTPDSTLSPSARNKSVPIELMGCVLGEVQRNEPMQFSGNWSFSHAVEDAQKSWKTYLAVMADNSSAVAFNEPVPTPNHTKQDCNSVAPGKNAWTVYKVISKTPQLQPVNSTTPPTPSNTTTQRR